MIPSVNLARIVVFQLAWILFAGWSYSFEFLAPLLAIVLVLIDYRLFNKQLSFRNLGVFFLFVLTAGVLIDSLILNLNFISFSNSKSALSPFYLWSIWIIFIPYYDFAFQKFHRKLYLSLPFALLGAPLAYYGGTKFGNLILHNYAIFPIAIYWAVFFPVSVELYCRLVDKEKEGSVAESVDL